MAAFLSRTYASAGNRRTFTISTWLKLTNLSNSQSIFYGDTAGNTNGTNDDFYWNSNYKITYGGYNSVYITSTAVFRDVSAWYHVVLSVDTTQATSANRIKLYVNGVEQARTEGAGYPAQNFETAFIKSGAFQICGNSPASGYGLHNLANFYYIDGTALTPSSFGETDATTGIWKPKSYAGSYGTNGFFLKFANSASLGTDSSGNGNTWTVNNTPTQTLDTPSNVFAVLNPLFPFNDNLTFSNGNLRATKPSGSATGSFYGSFGVTAGKWYWEMKCNAVGGNDQWIGIGQMRTLTPSGYPGNDTYCVAAGSGGEVRYNGTTVSSYTMASWTSGDTIMIALDMTNSRVYWGKNGTWQDSGDPVAGTNPYTNATIFDGNFIMPVGSLYQSNGDVSYNFGNGYFTTTAISSPYSDGAGLGKFQYQPPTGYYALCTKNINVYG
jgi:hypothetical protein